MLSSANFLFYRNASPLPLAPLTVAGFLAVVLLALAILSAYRLAGLLGFCCLVFVSLGFSLSMCAGSLVSGFLFYLIRSAFAAASPQPFTLAHCFKTLGSDVLAACWLVGLLLLGFRFTSFLYCNVWWLAGFWMLL